MRTFVIAFGLIGLYTLCAPVGQPVWVHLSAGILCTMVAVAITGVHKEPKIVLGIDDFVALVMPYVMLLTGIAFSVYGASLYIRGPETMTMGGAEVISVLDETLPLIFCLTGVILLLASGAHLYLRRRQKKG